MTLSTTVAGDPSPADTLLAYSDVGVQVTSTTRRRLATLDVLHERGGQPRVQFVSIVFRPADGFDDHALSGGQRRRVGADAHGSVDRAHG